MFLKHSGTPGSPKVHGKGRKGKTWWTRKWESSRKWSRKGRTFNHFWSAETTFPFDCHFPKWFVQSFEITVVMCACCSKSNNTEGDENKNNNSFNSKLAPAVFPGQSIVPFQVLLPSFWPGAWLEGRRHELVCWIFSYSYKYSWAMLWDTVTWRQFDSFQFVFKLC